MEPINPKTVKMHYMKNSDYRTVFATGFIGGPTPNGLINIDILTDRLPIPQSVTLDGTVQPPIEVERESKSGIIREVPIGLLMDINAAKQLREWLDKNIGNLDKIIQKSNPNQPQ
jgi:hypothetical protein